jgi:hypothetical protein
MWPTSVGGAGEYHLHFTRWGACTVLRRPCMVDTIIEFHYDIAVIVAGAVAVHGAKRTSYTAAVL